MANAAPNVGSRMRRLRERNGLSLRALAEQCNLSVNAISMIERGETSPKVSSLHLLATALNVRITDFFEGNDDESTVCVRRDERPVTKGEELIIESVGTGLANQQLEPFVVTVSSGQGSGAGATDEAIEHPGQEFIYCLEGTVTYRVGSDIFELEEGDSLLFDATQPHAFRNDGRETARVLIVLQAPEGTGIARERHLRV